jgi:phosphohistidine phosphatase
MTNIYLIRHGIAADRLEYERDSDRPLTAEGRQKTKKVAQSLLKMGINFDLTLTSPLIRGYQTAEILLQVGLSKKIETFDPLCPEGELQDWLNWWVKSSYNDSRSNLALVGHQPNLGNWAETLIWGSAEEKLIVKKAGIIGLKVPNTITPVGNCQLFLLTAPKWLLTS